MAYEEVTSPILTDATGQDIVDKLDEIAQNLQPPTNIEASDVSYDNTQSGMTATDVQEAVDELKSNLTDLSFDHFGTLVNVKSYTSSNKFTIPKDGYIQLSCTTGAGNYCNATISDGNGNGFSIGCVGSGSTYGYESCFVKKGMLFNIQGGNNHSANYIPIESE